MKKTIRAVVLLASLFLAFPGRAATVIYKTAEGKKMIVSKVKVLAINENLVVLKFDKGTRNISRSALLKYYDENISTTNGFEDNTQEYSVSLGSEDVPRSGVAGSRKKKSVASATFGYSISRKGNGTGNVRMPYFYLFVLTTGSGDYGSRKMYVYQYPEKEARTSSKSGYNEAKMLEKVLSADRPFIYDRSGSVSGMSGLKHEREAVFKLTGIENRKILAWHLVVWGKESIIAERDYKEIGERIDGRWWYHYQNR